MSSRLSSRGGEHDAKLHVAHDALCVSDSAFHGISTVAHRVGRMQAARVIDSLSDPERCIVEHLGRTRFATRQQLAGVVPRTESPLADTRRLQRQLTGLVERRVLARLDREVGGRRGGSQGPIYTLDVIGQRLVGTERLRRPWFVGDRFVAHALAITDVYVALAGMPGRNRLAEFVREPDCWRRFRDRSGTPFTLKPDAFVRVINDGWEHLSFVEVDLATESLGTITRKALQYWIAFGDTSTGDADPFPAVVWLTTSTKRHDALVEALARTPAEQWRLHRVGLLTAAADVFIQNVT